MNSPQSPATHGHEHIILTAVGADRPGIVEEVSAFIFERGGNIEDSRMVNLCGQFAIVTLVGASRDVLAKLRNDLESLITQSHLHAELHPAQTHATRQVPSRPYRLTATALDQAGLVHRIAHLLRERDVNIESLDTRLVAAPYTGAPVFEMELTLAVPESTQIAGLRKELANLCDQANIDWTMNAS